MITVGARKKTVILYIDDSAVEREIVRELLEAEGCEVLATGNPKAGIDLARKKKPDLILLDLHMPDMDGCAVVDRLRELPVLQPIPVVALSASIKEEEREEVYARFDGFLKKPVDVDAFPVEVRGFISQGRVDTVAPDDGQEVEKGERAGLPEDMREVLEMLENIRSVISHDLRAPLTVMISYASTVGREKVGNLSERQKEMLELVVEQGFEMDTLISELATTLKEILARYGQ